MHPNSISINLRIISYKVSRLKNAICKLTLDHSNKITHR
jgi:hypothetical protein